MQEFPNQPENHDLLAELRDLLAAFEANELTEEQDARLQKLVVENETLQRYYLQYMFMYGGMYQKHRHARRPKPVPGGPSANNAIFPLLDIESDLLSSSEKGGNFGGATGSNSGGFFSFINFSFVPGLIMILALALCLSVVVIFPIYWGNHPQDPRWNVVAKITKTVDCQWSQREKPEGSFLTAGEILDLEVGLAEIEFSSGAKLILQGPARFIASGHNLSRLEHGRLAAVVPESAHGFTVRTPGMDVVDLGTEFGVSVSTNHKADVHVFKGTVEVTSVTKSGEKETIQLHQHDAVEYDKTAGGIVPISVDTKQFVRNISTTHGITTTLQVANPSFEIPDIRTVPEYQPEQGDTQFRAIYGWKVSDPNQTMSRIAMYQISPYKSPIPKRHEFDVGPGATDGRQVVALMLKGPNSLPRCEWLYQSLGTITTADIGKKLKLSVDAGVRSEFSKTSKGQSVFAGFALNVTPDHLGTVIEKTGVLLQNTKEPGKSKATEPLIQLDVTIPISVELVGQELFVLLGANDNGSDSTTQFHFDNVRIVAED